VTNHLKKTGCGTVGNYLCQTRQGEWASVHGGFGIGRRKRKGGNSQSHSVGAKKGHHASKKVGGEIGRGKGSRSSCGQGIHNEKNIYSNERKNHTSTVAELFMSCKK